MTAKQMASWEKWHRRGRRKFQLFVAAVWFFGFGVSKSGLELALGNSPEWFHNLNLAAAIASILYFAYGRAWDQRTAEYRQQHSTASTNQPGVK